MDKEIKNNIKNLLGNDILIDNDSKIIIPKNINYTFPNINQVIHNKLNSNFILNSNYLIN